MVFESSISFGSKVKFFKRRSKVKVKVKVTGSKFSVHLYKQKGLATRNNTCDMKAPSPMVKK